MELKGNEDLKQLEGHLKNKFRWAWLQEKDSNNDFYSDYIRKINVPGKVKCIWCEKILDYSKDGKKAMKQHGQTKVHIGQKNIRKSNQTLPANFFGGGKDSSVSQLSGGGECALPYGAPPNIHDVGTCKSLKKPIQPLTSFQDRKSHAESTTLAFMALNSLPFTMSPQLIQYAKEMARDPKVLSSLSMESTTASYKAKYGMAKSYQRKLVQDMRQTFFSLNIDECFSAKNEKILSILVSYYSEEDKETVVKHYRSVSMTVVNASTLFAKVKELLDMDDIPYSNLISNLSDSTNYMRGKLTGFETRLRELCPHLLDIDGDVCHHVHNVVRVFTKPFEHHVESLLDDIHTDSQWSPDLREALKETCFLMGIKYNTPKQRIPHRWLSVLDVSLLILQMWAALTVMYFTWIPKEEKQVYKEICDQAKANVSTQGKAALNKLLQPLQTKQLTGPGKERKKRIVEKLYYERDKTMLYLTMYCELLPLFKSFILTFEQEVPMMHRLYEEQVDMVKHLLAFFIKPQVLNPLGGTKLKKLNVNDCALHKHEDSIFVGTDTEKLLDKFEVKQQKEFRQKMMTAYCESGKYILGKFPLTNKVLKCLSAIDPKVQGQDAVCPLLEKLKSLLPTVIRPEEDSQFDKEMHSLQLASLPDCLETNESQTPVRIDKWWSSVFSRNEYPVFSKLIKASLSIFTGPHVERSFSEMNNLVNKKTNRIAVETYSALQTIRSHVKSKKKSALQYFHREDILHDPVDKDLCFHMQTAYGHYKKHLQQKAQDRAEKEKTLQIVPPKKSVSTVHQRAKKTIKAINEKKRKHVSTANEKKRKHVSKSLESTTHASKKSEKHLQQKAQDRTEKEKTLQVVPPKKSVSSMYSA